MPSLADLIQFCFAGITIGATYGLVAVGFNVIFNATGAVNFAQGEFAMLGGMLGAALLTWSGLPLPAVIVLTVLAVTAIGVLLERLAIKVFADRGNPERFVALGRLASVAALAPAASGVPPGLEVTHYFQPPDIAYSSGAHVALAEVDPDTLQVRIGGYWISHDSGRLINPTIVEGQLQGAVALGLGSALLEKIRYDTAGQPLCASYMDYALPRSDDIPPLEIDHLETPSPLNPLGLKGVGESGTLPVAAAVASAVEDALGARGVRVDEMPLMPAALQRLLRRE